MDVYTNALGMGWGLSVFGSIAFVCLFTMLELKSIGYTTQEMQAIEQEIELWMVPLAKGG